MIENKELIKCLKKIEEKLLWGPPADWTQSNFEKLSQKIFNETQTLISSSSLRRLFGKTKTPNETYNPQMETKNALARFIGFSSWSNYIEQSKVPKYKKLKKEIVFMAAFLLISTLLISFFKYSGLNYKLEDLSFELQNLESNTIPHTVVLKYKIPSNANDIVVNFKSNKNDVRDEITKFTLDPGENVLTYTYNTKNYYLVSISNNERIIKLYEVYLTTDGWEGFLEQREKKYFIDLHSKRLNSRLMIPPSATKSLDIDTTKDYRTYFRYFRNIEKSGDFFTLESTIVASYKKEYIKCQHLQYDLRFEKGNIFFTLNQKGCGRNSNVLINNNMMSGDKHDLTQLTLNYNKKNKIKIQNKEHLLKIILNEVPAFELKHDNEFGEFKGIRLEYLGKMKVDTINLY